MVYNAAAVGVVLKRRSAQEGGELDQRFFMEHTDDVISLAVSSVNRTPLVATGELGKKPRIEVRLRLL
jgi:hypothetical protein